MKYCLTVIHNRLPRIGTFAPLRFLAFIHPMSIEFPDHCSQVLFGILLSPLYGSDLPFNTTEVSHKVSEAKQRE